MEKLLVQVIPPFPTMFQKASFLDTSKGVIVWEWVKRCVKHCSINLSINQILSARVPDKFGCKGFIFVLKMSGDQLLLAVVVM